MAYDDIINSLNLTAGIKDLYDVIPWAWDLLILAIVLSQIFTPVFKRTPFFKGSSLFGGEEKNAKRFANTLALIFSGSTVYWMQTEGYNIGMASPYIIYTLFIIFAVFVYGILASTDWGKDKKLTCGLIAVFFSFGLAENIFGAREVFGGTFMVLRSLLSFVAVLFAPVLVILSLLAIFKILPAQTTKEASEEPILLKNAVKGIWNVIISGKRKKEAEINEISSSLKQAVEAIKAAQSADEVESKKFSESINDKIQKLNNWINHLDTVLKHIKANGKLDDDCKSLIKFLIKEIGNYEQEFVARIEQNKNLFYFDTLSSENLKNDLNGNRESLNTKKKYFEEMKSKAKEEYLSLQIETALVKLSSISESLNVLDSVNKDIIKLGLKPEILEQKISPCMQICGRLIAELNKIFEIVKTSDLTTQISSSKSEIGSFKESLNSLSEAIKYQDKLIKRKEDLLRIINESIDKINTAGRELETLISQINQLLTEKSQKSPKKEKVKKNKKS